jgi:rhodanese-related sulfurtransferase
MTALRCIFAALLTLAATSANALEPDAVPAQKRTKANLYLSAGEVPAFLQSKGGRALFLDVRTPEELASVGSAPSIDANVPFKFATPPGLNADFAAWTDRRLSAKGLNKTDPVVLMCRSGNRSAAAADILTAAGYTQVYSVADGFEGDGKGGWKMAGLPWGYTLEPGKAAPKPGN